MSFLGLELFGDIDLPEFPFPDLGPIVTEGAGAGDAPDEAKPRAGAVGDGDRSNGRRAPGLSRSAFEN